MRDKGGLDRQLRDPEFRRLYQQEKLILDATELVAEAMKQSNVSRADLARRLDRTRGFVTQILSGSRNLTLRTLADVMTSLGFEVQMSREPLEALDVRPADWGAAECASVGAQFVSADTSAPAMNLTDHDRLAA